MGLLVLLVCVWASDILVEGVGRQDHVEDDDKAGEYLVLLELAGAESESGGVESRATNIDNSATISQRERDVIERLKAEFSVDTVEALQVGDTHILVLKGDDQNMAQARAGLPEIAIVERNRLGSLNGDCITLGTGQGMWGLDRLDQIEPIALWREGRYNYAAPLPSDEDVDVYVVDTGIYIENGHFRGRAIWGYTAQTNDDLSPTDQDVNGHGTFVAGLVGSHYGVAKYCTMIAVKVGNGVTSMAAILDGLQWVYEDHKEKNNNMGCIFPETTAQCHKAVLAFGYGFEWSSTLLEMVIKALVTSGVVVVAGAGNDGEEACSWTPAMIPDVITVGSTTYKDKIADHSNYGPCVDIYAPGEVVRSTYIGWPLDTFHSSGTSYAAGYVAGVIANFLKSTKRPVTRAKVMKWLMKKGTLRNVITFNCHQGCCNNRLIHQPCIMDD